MPRKTKTFSGCTACLAGQLKLCSGLRMHSGGQADVSSDVPVLHAIPARRTICSRREWPDFVHIICSGWAMTSITQSDGRRQVLSFLLPGDSESTLSLFQPRFGRAIEAVTDVLYRRFKRDVVREKMFARPDLLETLGKTWSDERERADQLAVDLGRRTADERIARQLLDLADRLAKLEMVHEGAMEFPLRQRQIADSTGLTPVHVSRILCEFQRERLIEIKGRKLAILDADKLRRVAECR